MNIIFTPYKITLLLFLLYCWHLHAVVLLLLVKESMKQLRVGCAHNCGQIQLAATSQVSQTFHFSDHIPYVVCVNSR